MRATGGALETGPLDRVSHNLAHQTLVNRPQRGNRREKDMLGSDGRSVVLHIAPDGLPDFLRQGQAGFPPVFAAHAEGPLVPLDIGER